MKTKRNSKPVVLVIAGHDPTGGAGIQADIEAIACNGCHATSVITCLTTQNTSEFKKSIKVDPLDFQEQVELILDDMMINACKVGLITDLGILTAIEKILIRLKNIPVVLDPVINAGTDQKIITRKIYTSIVHKLSPFVSIMTPNSIEARELTGLDDLDAAADALIVRGCKSVLITGTHEQSEKVINTLYTDNDKIQYVWERLPDNYHGSGCTLSASISAQLAFGMDIKKAVELAQEYTRNTLMQALKIGKRQLHPNRFYQD
jgi:hydroxymethylpyrimidine/phosphomethylpyrimidine kinase